jgi:hypothetical protein
MINEILAFARLDEGGETRQDDWVDARAIAREAAALVEPTAIGTDAFIYSRVFCARENSPPLRLLLDFLKSRGQVPLIPRMDPAALDEWAWVQISLGYHRERKPIQLFCIRDRGSYQDIFEHERALITTTPFFASSAPL